MDRRMDTASYRDARKHLTSDFKLRISEDDKMSCVSEASSIWNGANDDTVKDLMKFAIHETLYIKN